MNSPFDSDQKGNNYSEFQVNIFSNNRDIRLHLENSKSKKGIPFLNKRTIVVLYRSPETLLPIIWALRPS